MNQSGNITTREPETVREIAVTLRTALAQAAAALAGSSDTAHLDAEVLLADMLKCPRTRLHAWSEDHLAPAQLADFEARIKKRTRGMPVAYLCGHREFWSLPLLVNRNTLIPRPETETVVDVALQLLSHHTSACIADLGTGSGAIALAIAHERPQFDVLASDCCPRALAVALSNARRMQLPNTRFVLGSWCRPLRARCFDLIAANPPYVASGDSRLLSPELRFEPRLALAAGADGLQALCEIIKEARHHLRPGGWLVLEHGIDQGEAVRHLAALSGYQQIVQHEDLAGKPRVVAARHPG